MAKSHESGERGRGRVLKAQLTLTRESPLTALPWAGKGDRENQIHLDEVHDLLIALVSKFLNLNQGSGSFGMHCIL